MESSALSVACAIVAIAKAQKTSEPQRNTKAKISQIKSTLNRANFIIFFSCITLELINLMFRRIFVRDRSQKYLRKFGRFKVDFILQIYLFPSMYIVYLAVSRFP